MRRIWLDEAEPRPRKVAIGTFDGVHLGHREVIRGADAVLTFEPHPVAVVHPESAPPLLTTAGLKERILATLGLDEMIVINFDEEFTHLRASEFIDQVLVKQLQATDVSVGENFRFGWRAEGDAELLMACRSFETRVVPLVEIDGEVVSSSQIRGLVAAGNVRRAAKLLGYPFTMCGPVVGGDQRGRELGFPTANLIPGEHHAVPGHGVYAALTNGLPSAVNVGVRPTFETGRGLLVESYIIDWSGDLYGQEIEVAFLERLRGERRYSDVDSLVKQMQRDVIEAKQACERAAGGASALRLES